MFPCLESERSAIATFRQAADADQRRLCLLRPALAEELRPFIFQSGRGRPGLTHELTHDFFE